jgi:cobalt-zinc-cadmium resistance protein CzcA
MTGLQAQQELPLDSCIRMAVRTHPSIRSMENQQAAALKNRQSAWDIGTTDISMMGGQYNSVYDDFQFSLNQGIPFPGKMVAEFKLLKTEAEMLGSAEMVARKQVTMIVEELWMKTAIATSRLALLDSLSKFTAQLRNMALLRYTSGESTLLEKLLIEQKAEMAESELMQAKESLKSLQRRLTMLCGAQQTITAPVINMSKEVLEDINLTEPVWLNHPAVQYNIFTVKKAEQQLGIEKMKLFPDFRLGMFNQSLTGIQEINGEQVNFTRADRFTGYSAGLSIPLWFVPQKARISAKRIEADAARFNQEDALLSLRLNYERLSSEFKNAILGLQLLEQTQLKVSEKALAAATLGWKQGQFSYLELIYAVDQHLQVQKNWLSLLDSITETRVQLHFLQN